MFAIRGRIVPLSADRTVSPGELDVFAGTVWLGDDGTVSQVTRGTQAGAGPPRGFETAAVVDVGSSLVFPGLVDLHNTWHTTRCRSGRIRTAPRTNPSCTTTPGPAPSPTHPT